MLVTPETYRCKYVEMISPDGNLSNGIDITSSPYRVVLTYQVVASLRDRDPAPSFYELSGFRMASTIYNRTRLQSKPTQASIQHSKMAITRMIYNSIMKRNSTYVSTIFAGSFIFSIGFDTLTSAWWEQHNKKKLWSTVRENLELK
ncbi:hypothetical protein PGTUg99_016894 [Puccinia graminis f. sp. tritici]|uniref:Complex III subunit 9 n=2 Tax=Puccinia graminis f. sp. tritici TaxID=56615 RepID=A0A5B0RFF9_PUCGR|nr:hypothetical protein PGTUg99_016894 [Puccinia graminis f. sp. tritici]